MRESEAGRGSTPERFDRESLARSERRVPYGQRILPGQASDTDPDPAGAAIESPIGSDSSSGPLLVWRRTPSDMEPAPGYGHPDRLPGLPPPAIVVPGATSPGEAVAWAMDNGVDTRDLRLSQPRRLDRWTSIRLPDGADLTGGSLVRQVIGHPGGCHRNLVARDVLLNGAMLRGRFEGCDFSGCEMIGISFRLATFADCRFRGAVVGFRAEGPLRMEGADGIHDEGATVWMEYGHPADIPAIDACHPLFQSALLRWRARRDVRMHRLRWSLHRLLGGGGRWPYPEEKGSL